MPPGYELLFDADMILLRREEATVAAFGVADTTPSEVRKAAWEDYGDAAKGPSPSRAPS